MVVPIYYPEVSPLLQPAPFEWPQELQQKLENVKVAGRPLLQSDGRPDPAILCAAAGAAVADVSLLAGAVLHPVAAD